MSKEQRAESREQSNKKNHTANALKQPKKWFYTMLFFTFMWEGGVSDSHVQAHFLPVGARKGDEQVGRSLFFDKCQTTGVGGQVVQEVD